MSTTTNNSIPCPAPSPSAQKRFEELQRWAYYRNTTIEFYKRLTDGEREILGEQLHKAWSVYHIAPNMWIKLYGGTKVRAVIGLARSFNYLSASEAVWLLREYGESPLIKSANAEIAISEKGLVINRYPRAVYWRGQPIRCDWNVKYNKSYEILVAAATKAKRCQPLCPSDLDSDPKPNSISKSLSRLKNILEFPADLGGHFIPDRSCSEPGSQRLNLPHSMIHIFDTEAADF
ncbi:hypothetical protein [uncultured Rubinisphaera sp.]|uniref:hypothetical protein n=1 Tax=uncultured Rubinisphaera sp. TaxID=1678686 RepID=UPI0030DD219C|tara:strand:+ start:45 stop:743 length:699 start_codon:yes stop_codon:yes gene_type:complete